MIDRAKVKMNILKKGEIIVALTTILILILLACFGGKVIEETIMQEITKWIFMGVLIVIVVCLLAWWPLSVYADFRCKKLEDKNKK